MTQLVTVQTDFRDLEQMAQGLAGRVQTTYVILPTGEAVDEGEWAQFEITLYDGSSGLAGVGRCVTVVDNGDERMPHQRYDVVFDSLQFDTHEQRVFEHILALHGVVGQEFEEVQAQEAESLPPAHEDTGEEYVDVGTEFTGQAHVSPVAEASDDDIQDADDAHQVARDEELEAALSDPSSIRPAPGGGANDVVPHGAHGGGRAAAAGGGAVYARGAVAHAVDVLEEAREEPLSGERINPARSVNGAAFAYTDGIPFPAKPPRPELDAALRVTPAPRPRVPSH